MKQQALSHKEKEELLPMSGKKRDDCRAKAKKIHFNEQVEMCYLTEEEMNLRMENRRDIWYMKSDLMMHRKQDRDTLLVELRALAAAMNPAGASATPPSPPVPSRPDTKQMVSSEPFYFRGLEVVVYKRERDEARKRSIAAVLSEQERLKNQATNNGKSDGSLSTHGSILVYHPPLQQIICEKYKLLTRNSLDDAYLRGLSDAREARSVFGQSLHFPSVSQRSPSLPRHSTRKSNMKKEFRDVNEEKSDELPILSGEGTTQATLDKLRSLKLLLQKKSQLRTDDSTTMSSRTTPSTSSTTLEFVPTQQPKTTSTIPQHWGCCSYGQL